MEGSKAKQRRLMREATGRRSRQSRGWNPYCRDDWVGWHMQVLILLIPLAVVVLLVSRANTTRPHRGSFSILSIFAVLVSVMGSVCLRRRASTRGPHRTEAFPLDEPISRRADLYVARCDFDGWSTSAEPDRSDGRSPSSRSCGAAKGTSSSHRRLIVARRRRGRSSPSDQRARPSGPKSRSSADTRLTSTRRSGTRSLF